MLKHWSGRGQVCADGESGRLARACGCSSIKGVSPDPLDEVIAGASPEEMANRPEPQRTGANSKVVGMTPWPSDEGWGGADRRFAAALCRRNLK